MTHELGHIECGGGGAVMGEKNIKIWDHEFLNVANHLKRPELIARLIADGKTPEQAEQLVEQLGDGIHRDIEGWYKWFERHGIEVHYHRPHAENFP